MKSVACVAVDNTNNVVSFSVASFSFRWAMEVNTGVVSQVLEYFGLIGLFLNTPFQNLLI